MSMNRKLLDIILPHTSEVAHEGNPAQIIAIIALAKEVVDTMDTRIKELESEVQTLRSQTEA